MADKKISDFTETTSVGLTDWVEIETAAGNSRKVQFQNFRSSEFSGALVHKAADETTANYSAGSVIAWDSEASGYDTDSYHDTVTNNSRLTIATTGKYRVSFALVLQSLAASEYARALVIKNGSVGPFHGGAQSIVEVSAAVNTWMNGDSAVVGLTAGDYLELWLDTEADTSITVTAIGSWFAIQRIT